MQRTFGQKLIIHFNVIKRFVLFQDYASMKRFFASVGGLLDKKVSISFIEYYYIKFRDALNASHVDDLDMFLPYIKFEFTPNGMNRSVYDLLDSLYEYPEQHWTEDYDAMECLYINYMPPNDQFPILTNESVRVYKLIFQLLVYVYFVERRVDELIVGRHDFSSAVQHEGYSLRNLMRLFISELRAYLLYKVLSVESRAFTKKLGNATNVEEASKCHHQFTTLIQKKCMLNDLNIYSTLMNCMNVIVSYCKLIMDGVYPDQKEYTISAYAYRKRLYWAINGLCQALEKYDEQNKTNYFVGLVHTYATHGMYNWSYFHSPKSDTPLNAQFILNP